MKDTKTKNSKVCKYGASEKCIECGFCNIKIKDGWGKWLDEEE